MLHMVNILQSFKLIFFVLTRGIIVSTNWLGWLFALLGILSSISAIVLLFCNLYLKIGSSLWTLYGRVLWDKMPLLVHTCTSAWKGYWKVALKLDFSNRLTLLGSSTVVGYTTVMVTSTVHSTSTYVYCDQRLYLRE